VYDYLEVEVLVPAEECLTAVEALPRSVLSITVNVIGVRQYQSDKVMAAGQVGASAHTMVIPLLF
jgi:hypothetical protein